MGNSTNVQVDEVRVPLEIRIFPSPEEMRAVAENPNATPHEHGQLMTVRWEATERFANPQKVSLTFPKEIGPVLITFVQPTTRWTQPGSAAVFPVLELPGQTKPEPTSRNGLGAIAVVVALLSLVGNIFLVRKGRG